MQDNTAPSLPGRPALIVITKNDETSRMAIIYAHDTPPEELAKSIGESKHLAWIYSRREYPLEQWSEPSLHLEQYQSVLRGTARIQEILDTLTICDGIMSEWKHGAPRWRTKPDYRHLNDAEALQVGDKIFCASGNSNTATIDRLTPKRAYAGAVHWPRVFTSRGFRASNRHSIRNDIAYRAI